MEKISELANVHEGKRVFILASGPSLAKLDLSRLARRMVIGLNRSCLVYPETHYHVTMDQRLFDLHGEDLHKTRCLITLEDRPWGMPLHLLGAEGFSWDLEEGVYSGYTVSYFALQVAVYLGFKEVVYLGLDLKNEGRQTHFFGSDFHSLNHDNTEYPRMHRMLEYGASLLRTKGVTIFNCSPVSDLAGFEKISYDYAISL